VTVDVIATAADKLWKELTSDAKTINITSVQLAFTGLEKAEMGQKTIEGFFKTRDVGQSPSLKRPREEDELSGTEATNLVSSNSSNIEAISFQCQRCHKVISLRQDQFTSGPDEARRLATLRLEHDDFHFAQDLARGNEVPVSRRSPSRGMTQRRKVEPKGIPEFFSKK
jgi:DNA polymerase eta